MNPYKLIQVRPLRDGWAVYVCGVPVIDPTSRHEANVYWSRLINMATRKAA